MGAEHDTWSVERIYPHPPARVFAAWARPELKIRWFDLSDGGPQNWVTEFRIGGVERFRSPAGVTPSVTYEARYHDIVDDRRIVCTYEIVVDGLRASVALTTVEFDADAHGTRLRCTEQGVFLDGLSSAGDHRDGLGRQLQRLADVLDA